MSYHESFWLAVAAAAPIIALANTVAITDTGSLWLASKAKRHSVPSIYFYFANMTVSVTNLLVQALIFYSAMKSLRMGKIIRLLVQFHLL
jgi:hypothetical protein